MVLEARYQEYLLVTHSHACALILGLKQEGMSCCTYDNILGPNKIVGGDNQRSCPSEASVQRQHISVEIVSQLNFAVEYRRSRVKMFLGPLRPPPPRLTRRHDK